MYFADLHIHSRFSRATSRDCDIPHLDWWARRKGLGLVGTGDFTHPAWRSELREQLVPAEEGLYTLRSELRLLGNAPGPAPRFVVTGEISCIYKRHGRTRKVHNLILLPSLEAADEVAARLEAVGNIRSDGRPILGLDSRDLLELTLEACPEAELIPAHIWTPHFAMFGAFSGFDSIQECFGDLTGHIHGVETGLSSDPPMNWRVSALDGLTLVSHSDAHSPAKLGREADMLETELSYPGLLRAIQTGEGVLGTVEFFPEEGKYHLDGHRSCGVCLTPAETEARGGLCPVCGKKLTIGVEHRVEALADRPAGFRPEGAKPFESLAPLPEVIAASTGTTPTGKKTLQLYETLLAELGPELEILRRIPTQDIERLAGPCVAEGLRRLRAGQVERRAGFDGVYGGVTLLRPEEIERYSGQVSLFAPQADATRRRPARDLCAQLQGEKKETPVQVRAEALNAAQEEAVRAQDGAVAVVAGPGTGKTKTLVARIAWLVEERGAHPEEITAVTFTNQAAGELRRRLEERLGRRAAERMTIGTFHAICLRLLEGARLLGRGEALTLAGALAGPERARALLQQISRVKKGAAPEEAGLGEELYRAYCARVEELGALDLDDLLERALEVDAGGRRCFTHLLVDEFQDIDPTQYHLVRQWSRAGKTLFVIGDPDQAIYGFRGASDRCFDRLGEEMPGLRLLHLTENYRSSPEILGAALPVIEQNPGGVRLLHPNRPQGLPVRLLQGEDIFQQGAAIAREIGRMTGGVDMLQAQALGTQGECRAFSDIAVLCRTHHQLEQVERCLRREDIPCVVSGRGDLLEAGEVRGMLSFCRSLLAPQDGAALGSALRLIWDCPPDLVETARRACADLERFDPEALEERVRGYGVLEDWVKRGREWLPLVEKEKPWKLAERWSGCYGKTAGLERLRATAVFHGTFSQLWEALTLGEEADVRRAEGRGWKSGAVQLMTLHGSKGLEFPAVFLAGLDRGTVPLESRSRPADPEEERRLLFVGMTRAREELILTAGPELSPFLEGLPKSLIRREQLPRRERTAQQLSLF